VFFSIRLERGLKPRDYVLAHEFVQSL
jgi:hypothetical protein